jgi:hypothetical protein
MVVGVKALWCPGELIDTRAPGKRIVFSRIVFSAVPPDVSPKPAPEE